MVWFQPFIVKKASTMPVLSLLKTKQDQRKKQQKHS